MNTFCGIFLIIAACVSICIATSPIYKPPPQDSVSLNANDLKKSPHQARYLQSANKNQELTSKNQPRPMETSRPNDQDLEDLAEEALEPSASGVAFPRDNPDEDMETAENIVFRPLFRYKKQNVERRTVYRDRNGNISNQPQNPKPQSATQKPPKNPPPVLVFDKVTGSYYPASSQYSSYYPGAYPAYFRGASQRR
ncbi:uncharacterized protein LOC143916103 [Arctopsyche grandis]|uniref:uncharacterized protein LOC143916103 n=1 Tax=Arctopsyche grandis TaxID=121162 RepID=UPI00406D8D1F